MIAPDDFGVDVDRGHALLWERYGAEVMFRLVGVPEEADDGWTEEDQR